MKQNTNTRRLFTHVAKNLDEKKRKKLECISIFVFGFVQFDIRPTRQLNVSHFRITRNGGGRVHLLNRNRRIINTYYYFFSVRIL